MFREAVHAERVAVETSDHTDNFIHYHYLSLAGNRGSPGCTRPATGAKPTDILHLHSAHTFFPKFITVACFKIIF